MYSDAVVTAQQEKLEVALKGALPGGALQRYAPAVCHEMVRRLEAIKPDGPGARPLSTDEQVFVANERLLTKIDYRYWGERYCVIQADGQRLKPMFPLFESQELILAEVARVEEQRWRDGHPDGLLFNVLKGRQLGASTLVQSMICHRVTTHGHVKGLIASDVPDNSGSQGLFGMLERVYEHLPWWLKPRERFHTKDHHLVLENGSSVIVESGKSMKGGLQEQGGQKGQLGRSKTYSVGHLSELSTWEYPETIRDSLMWAIPRTPRTLLGRESTAKGRYNFWHKEWLLAEQGLGRFFNIFVPFYAERSKYWLPYPTSWEPSADTLAFAARASEVGPRYMHRQVDLSKEQLYWYEREKAAAEANGELYKFLEEMPAEPSEAFQYSGRSIFPVGTMDRLTKQARPLLDVWAVKPKAELLADRDALVQELRASQKLTQQAIVDERLRAAGRVTVEPDGVRVDS